MDEQRVVPQGSHFAAPKTHNGFKPSLNSRDRCKVAPVSYFYIDFGLSSQWPNGKQTARRLGVVGGVQAPELSTTVAYNPFPSDIYQLGATLLEVSQVSDYRINFASVKCLPYTYPALPGLAPLRVSRAVND